MADGVNAVAALRVVLTARVNARRRASTPGRMNACRRALMRVFAANYMLPASRRREFKMSKSEEDLALIGLHLISK